MANTKSDGVPALGSAVIMGADDVKTTNVSTSGLEPTESTASKDATSIFSLPDAQLPRYLRYMKEPPPDSEIFSLDGVKSEKNQVPQPGADEAQVNREAQCQPTFDSRVQQQRQYSPKYRALKAQIDAQRKGSMAWRKHLQALDAQRRQSGNGSNAHQPAAQPALDSDEPPSQSKDPQSRRSVTFSQDVQVHGPDSSASADEGRID